MGKISMLAWTSALLVAGIFAYILPSSAAPAGSNWFQLIADPSAAGTGSDDLDYYYVGQSFTTGIVISADMTTAANVWIDFPGQLAASGINTGSFFPYWSGQTLDAGRVMSSGYVVGSVVSGVGDFGSVLWTVNQPTEPAYGTASPGLLDVVVGEIGLTTESNISYQGKDKLESAQGLLFHAWADTKKPYAQKPDPVHEAQDVPVDKYYVFELRDSKNGEGDDSGSGTGVNKSQPPGAVSVNSVAVSPQAILTCSGMWGSAYCKAKVDPPSPLGIDTDKRNWEYGKKYIIDVSGFTDLASPHQDQLGDKNGPNTMDPKRWSFTTEQDSVAPRVVAEYPKRGSDAAPASVQITADVVDLRDYTGEVSGVGLDSATCVFSIWSGTSATSTFLDGNVNLSAEAIPFGFRFTISPAAPFAQNDWIYVMASGCKDLAGNQMSEDIWRFQTSDTTPPYVDTLDPAPDFGLYSSGTVSFHVKDAGIGVDLSKLVVYVDGTYYKQVAGGPGQVTVKGTRITYPAASAFSSLSGTPADYTVVITPPQPFTPGSGVPVLVYAQDLAGNIMERFAYGLAVAAENCQTGESFCALGTAWDGSTCIAACPSSTSTQTIATSTPDTSMVPTVPVESAVFSIYDVKAESLDPATVIISWHTNLKSTARVLFSDKSVADVGTSPNFGYAASTAKQQDDSTFHVIQVSGLEMGKVYVFRPVSSLVDRELLGPELKMSPVWIPPEITIASTTEAIECPAIGALPDMQEPQAESPRAVSRLKPSSPVQTVFDPIARAVGSTSPTQAGGLALLAITLVNVTAGAAGLWNLFILLFTQPIYMLGRRRKQGYGVVFDSLTHKPVNLAAVRLLDSRTGHILLTQVTDTAGRYAIKAEPGKYRLEIAKNGFVFPSQLLDGATQDASYTDVFVGSEIYIDQSRVFIKNIPLDPLEDKRTVKRVILEKYARKFQSMIAVFGPVASIGLAIWNPGILTVCLVVFQFLAWLVFRKLSVKTMPDSFGTITDDQTNGPVSRAVVRIIDAKYNRVLETQVTDRHGRYGFLAGRGNFYLMVVKKGYSDLRTEPMDLTLSQQTTQVVAQSLVLRRTKESLTSTPITP